MQELKPAIQDASAGRLIMLEILEVQLSANRKSAKPMPRSVYRPQERRKDEAKSNPH